MYFNRDRITIIILWLIREYQPINMRAIVEQSRNPDALPEFARMPHMSGRFHQGVADYVQELIDMGLVQTENGQPLTPDSALKTTKVLPGIQDLFAVSLTKLLSRRENTLEIDPIFNLPTDKSAWGQVFVAMPFAADFPPIYTDHIKKVTDELGVTCNRADNFFHTGSIIHDIWSAIYHADLCIVDCTRRNPNVFYELGIAHTLGRKAILIAQNIDDMPFDVLHLRTIPYEYNPPGMQKFEATLKKTIQQELGLNE